MVARNDEESIEMIIPGLKEAVDYTVQKIWNDNRELVRTVVYEAYAPKEYKRTGEFKEAWDTSVKTAGTLVEGTFKYDDRELTVDYDEWQHGSKILQEPMTTYLAEIIYQGLAGPIFGDGPWRRKRNAWEILNKRLGKNKLRKYLEEGMSKSGMRFKRRSAGIQKVEYYG